jgi:Ulp1 family protease
MRMLHDPTILRSLASYGVVDHDELQRLKANQELNSEIINMYLWQCQEQCHETKRKALGTFFWAQLLVSEKKGYDAATRMLFKTMVNIFLGFIL